MNHYDEHTLELFVLGSDSVADRQQAISEHLEECANCRDLVVKMKSFYADFYEELQKHTPEVEEAEKRLVLASQRVAATSYDESHPAQAYRPVTTLQRIQHFARTHPIVVGGGTFFAFAAVALLALNTQNLLGDRNPATYRFNVPEERVEILNASGDPLWGIMIWNAADQQKLDVEAQEMKAILITDLDSDGKNEVVSVLPTDKDRAQPGRPLRIYSHDGTLKQTIRLDTPIEYLQREYVEAWFARGVKVTSPDSSGRRELIVLWTCNRSPNIIARHDAQGNILGEYWHFGQWHNMEVMDVFNDGKERLLLMGMNDIHDTLHLEFPSIAVLDIEKITGRKKSLTTPGFSLPFSNAEVTYVRLPRSQLSVLLNTNEIARRLRLATKDRLAFVVNGADGSYDYEYIFTRTFAIKSVKSTTSTDLIIAGLVAQGKATSKIDSTYLSTLKNGVRYFDGEEWKNEPTRIGGKAILANRSLNPAYTRESPGNGVAEVFNEQGEILWSIHTLKGQPVAAVGPGHTGLNVADLDGDGINEVISTLARLPLAYETNALRVYDYKGQLLFERRFARNFKYLDRDYSPNISLGYNTIGRPDAVGKREIWVTGNSFGRSPSLVLRLDGEGNTLGEYWHFGNVSIFAHDIDYDGNEEIVLTGLNDVDDEINLSTSVIIVLDPEKIQGSTKSTISPGFGFPLSNAEKFVIALSSPDLAKVVKTNLWIRADEIRPDGVICMQYADLTYKSSGYGIAFAYIMNNDLSVREVKSTTNTDRFHRVLAAEGKVRGTIDAAYLQRLKESVRYWDGTAWKKEVTQVKHKPVVAKN